MFTRRNFKTLALATNLAWYSGIVPYHFVKHPSTGKLELIYSPTRWRVFLVRFTFLLSLTYVLFVAYRIFEKVALSEEEASLDFLVKMGYLISAYSIPVVVQINTLFWPEEMFVFYVGYIKFFKGVQGKAPSSHM